MEKILKSQKRKIKGNPDNIIIIEQIKEGEYLGIKLPGAIARQSQSSGLSTDTIWRNNYLRKEIKSGIYKTTIKSVMTYTTEMKTDTSKT